MKLKDLDNADVGVIVGRFQVDELHEAHINLIQTVVDTHDRVIIFLGLSQIKCTNRNPLDFEARKQMILQKFPDVIILYIKDNRSDRSWSNNLDLQINDIIGPNQSVVLYGSRDSFIDSYHGKYPCRELRQTTYVSGDMIRKSISNKVKASSDFRKGVIWAVYNQYPKCMPTVDIAIIDDSNNILLGQKPNEKFYRFIGGFVEPGETWEQAAKRETFEETNLEVEIIKYLGSYFVNDWRYKNEKDKITTTFFLAKKVFGKCEPNDDISVLKWFKIDDIIHPEKVLYYKNILVNEHIKLMENVINYLKKGEEK